MTDRERLMKYKSFNESELIKQFLGDEEILLDMISNFQDRIEGLLRPLRDSVIEKDSVAMVLNAHNFKGLMSNFYAEEVRLLAYELEKMGQVSVSSDAMQLLNKLENKLQIFLFELSIFKKSLV